MGRSERHAVWDDIKDGYYVDGDGVTEEFSSRWQAEDYLAQVRKETADREAEEWLYVERAKQAPMMEPETGNQPEESRTEPVETEPGKQQEPAEPLEQKSQPEQAENEDIVNPDYIETKTQYRKRTKSTTTAPTDKLSGWTYDHKEYLRTDYGNWGSWQDAAISPSDTVDVATQTVTLYNYYHYNKARMFS